MLSGRRVVVTGAGRGLGESMVHAIAAAGADFIVPGSLMFKEEPGAMRRWLATLDEEVEDGT